MSWLGLLVQLDVVDLLEEMPIHGFLGNLDSILYFSGSLDGLDKVQLIILDLEKGLQNSFIIDRADEVGLGSMKSSMWKCLGEYI